MRTLLAGIGESYGCGAGKRSWLNTREPVKLGMTAPNTPDKDAANSGNKIREQEQDDFFGPDDDDGVEFSLNQLSEAYAEVIEAQTGVKHTVGVPEESESSDDNTADAKSSSAVDDNAGCPISPESIVESILFVGAPRDVKLNSRKIAAALRDVSPKEVTKIVAELNRRYEKENAAYRIKADGGVFEMVLDPKSNRLPTRVLRSQP